MGNDFLYFRFILWSKAGDEEYFHQLMVPTTICFANTNPQFLAMLSQTGICVSTLLDFLSWSN